MKVSQSRTAEPPQGILDGLNAADQRMAMGDGYRPQACIRPLVYVLKADAMPVGRAVSRGVQRERLAFKAPEGGGTLLKAKY